MEEKEDKDKIYIEYILESLSVILSRNNESADNTSFVPASTEVYSSPEEGIRLILAFVRIKQPEVRAAIIKLATQVADH